MLVFRHGGAHAIDLAAQKADPRGPGSDLMQEDPIIADGAELNEVLVLGQRNGYQSEKNVEILGTALGA